MLSTGNIILKQYHEPKSYLIDFKALHDVYEEDIVPRLGVFAASVDAETVLMGEVINLVNGNKDSGLPSLTMLLSECTFPTDIKNHILHIVHTIAYSILDELLVEEAHTIKVCAIPGYSLKVDSIV